MIACDTNLLFLWLNADLPQHPAAEAFFESHSGDESFAICELALLELYGLLRNPVLNQKPLDAGPAAELIQTIRSHPVWPLLDYPGGLMDGVWKLARQAGFARRRVYDARLALTLRHHGVTELATANVKDFQGFGFKRVWNPLA